MTAVAGSILTAAQVNTFIRDNLRETMPAKASLVSSIFATSGFNEVAQRTPDAYSDNTSAEVTTTSFGDPSTGPAGPSAPMQTGVSAIVGYRVAVRVPSATARVEAAYAISGATEREATTNASLGYSLSNSASGMTCRVGVTDLATGLTPGLNVFTLKYNVSSGTGTVLDRRIWVLPL
jgi:hypothetical protein